MKLKKPKSLKPGDCIALVAPSASLSVHFPHRVELGVAALERMGFKVKIMPSVTQSWEGQGGTPAQRAAELHEVFLDPSIHGILAVIGGLTANSVAPLLDYELIAKHPKVFCGYSDIGVFHFALRKFSKFVTFYGPCLMTDFAEFPHPHPYTVEMFKAATMSPTPLGAISPSDTWTDEFLNWGDKSDLTRPRVLYPNTDGHTWIKGGAAIGRLEGGCIYTAHQLRGTPYEPDYDGTILVLETPEGMGAGQGFPLAFIESQLVDLANSGIFSKISGLVFGRGMGYSTDQRERLKELISRTTEKYSFPVLYNANIGHATPIMTLPLGVEASLDSTSNTFAVLEAGVS